MKILVICPTFCTDLCFWVSHQNQRFCYKRQLLWGHWKNNLFVNHVWHEKLVSRHTLKKSIKHVWNINYPCNLLVDAKETILPSMHFPDNEIHFRANYIYIYINIYIVYGKLFVDLFTFPACYCSPCGVWYQLHWYQEWGYCCPTNDIDKGTMAFINRHIIVNGSWFVRPFYAYL